MADPAGGRRRRRRVVLLVVAVVLVTTAVEIRLFVVPASASPGRVDAVVVLGGDDTAGRWARGLAVLAAHPGVPVLDSVGSVRYSCHPKPATASGIVCFRPTPFTTQGEARYVTAYARAHHLRSIAVVTTPDQTWRARLRFERCWQGDIRMVAAPMSIGNRLEKLAYQNAATLKALVLQRSC